MQGHDKSKAAARRQKAEMAVCRALGIEAFCRLLLSMERRRSKRKGYHNINYYLSAPTAEEAEEFMMYLAYNTAIHIQSLLWAGVYMLAVSYGCRRYFILDLIVAATCVLNLWCILLQRYTGLRLAEVKRHRAALLQRRVVRRARALHGQCSPEQARQLLEDLRHLRRQADVPTTVWTKEMLLPLTQMAELLTVVPSAVPAERTLSKRQLRVQRNARRLWKLLGRERPVPKAADEEAQRILDSRAPGGRLGSCLDLRIAVLQTYLDLEEQGGTINEQ